MSGPDEDTEKEFEASQQKLEDARKKGEVPRSSDLGTAAVYAGFLLGFGTLGLYFVQKSGTVLQNMIGQSDIMSDVLFSGPSHSLTGSWILAISSNLMPILFIPAVAVLLSFVAQRALIFAPSKIVPKASRISIISNAKNKFGRGGLFEFFKSLAKLLIYSVLVWIFLFRHTDTVLGAIHLSAGGVASLLSSMTLDFLSFVLIIAFLIGIADYLWQNQEHLRKNRMARKEVQDEHKKQEGDPHFKQQRRQRGYAIAMNQMLADVAEADVVIVNPTHFAVALKWDRNNGRAPVCVAKGVDEIALRIREKANESGVPIQRDPPSARALYASVEIGDEILREHYQAVAAAIRFADDVRKKIRRLMPSGSEYSS